MKLCLFLLLASSCWGQSFVSAIAAGNDSVTSVTTSSLSITSGNLLVVGAKFREGCGSETIMISNSGTAMTFTAIGSLLDNSTNMCMGMWYAKNAPATASVTFTMTMGASHRFPAISVIQVSGASTSAPLATSSTGVTTGNTTVTTGSFTPSATADIAVGFGQDFAASTLTPGTGYTNPSASNETFSGQFGGEYKTSIGTSSQTASIDMGGGSSIASIFMAVFTAGGSPPATKTCTLSLMGAGPC